MTANHICELLRDKYKQPEFAVAFEVGDNTGFKCRRHADAIAMSLYPSRGLGIYGFEIKISRNDLIKEIESPDKAEPIARFCNGWHLVYPTELKDIDLQIPAGWGIIKASESGLKTVRAAKELTPDPISLGFLAALFRGMCKEDEYRLSEAVKKRTEEIMKQANADVEYQIKRRTARAEEMEEAARKVAKETGINLFESSWRTPELIRAIQKSLHYQEPPIWKLKNIEGILRNSADQLAAEIAKLNGSEESNDLAGVNG